MRFAAGDADERPRARDNDSSPHPARQGAAECRPVPSHATRKGANHCRPVPTDATRQGAAQQRVDHIPVVS